jgi:hypothetical protein
MLEILKFIFSSFWIWLGCVVLIYAIGECLSVVIKSMSGHN